MRSDDVVSEDDLLAYVDDQLDARRRADMDQYLSRHPAAAQRVEADLRIRDALRVTAASAPPGDNAQSTKLARRLQRELTARNGRSRWASLALAATVFGVGWMTHIAYMQVTTPSSIMQPSAAFLDDAVMAHRTSLLRANMNSQPEVPYFDADEILHLVGIPMPPIPPNWVVRDVQVYPSSLGPSVEMVIDTDRFGSLSLFAARAKEGGRVQGVITSRKDVAAIAYWQEGTSTYALTGHLTDVALAQLAKRLTRQLDPQ
ncbi:hypothetical protein GCM10007242_32520 [Pigmentiphaga litoralis]|uniref:anti-sigma factor family protein n=1 Tax=Pigmentiphaga litoralis TaxID=516702 RepID=UPI0016770BF5|nr:anti-sigma factor [Pigmentiphaga litoralis]GGX22677.1 hypothetical protein GCM10007242_32520 [Pigmentiphaga litoralis]